MSSVSCFLGWTISSHSFIIYITDLCGLGDITVISYSLNLIASFGGGIILLLSQRLNILQ